MNEQETFSSRIEKPSPNRGGLLVINVPFPINEKQRERLTRHLAGTADRLKCELIVLEAGVTAQLQPSVSELLAEQRKQTALLEQIATQNLTLDEALADGSEPGPDAPHPAYLGGSPCR